MYLAIPNKNKKISSNTDSLYLLLYLIIILEKNKIELFKGYIVGFIPRYHGV